jgi:hypothetical protein
LTAPHTALTDVPQNLNFLSPLGFKFYIKRCPHVNFMLYRINVPGLETDAVPQATPFVPIQQTPDHGNFLPLNITFRVDEQLQNYLEIHSWLRNICKMDDFLEFASLKKQPEYTGLGIQSEIMLTILTSAKNPIIAFTFHGCFPISLSNLQFDAAMGDVEYLTASVEFLYTNFDYSRDL